MVYCIIEKYRKSEVKIYEASRSTVRESGYTEAYAAALRPSQAKRPCTGGQKPAEDPHALLEEYGRLCERYEELIRRTNLTNAATTDGGETLTALLARRDALIERISGLNDFLQEASNTAARATRSEIVIRSTVDVSALQKQADELSKQLRELDVRIQGLNWTTELK